MSSGGTCEINTEGEMAPCVLGKLGEWLNNEAFPRQAITVANAIHSCNLD